ncbi:hypothetical protein EES40_36545 [Streptomyces sp. ADI93-02]|nr:hypothetical protein EES40_36545 [Streptomyces sp. ADI93-02]
MVFWSVSRMTSERLWKWLQLMKNWISICFTRQIKHC